MAHHKQPYEPRTLMLRDLWYQGPPERRLMTFELQAHENWTARPALHSNSLSLTPNPTHPSLGNMPIPVPANRSITTQPSSLVLEATGVSHKPRAIDIPGRVPEKGSLSTAKSSTIDDVNSQAGNIGHKGNDQQVHAYVLNDSDDRSLPDLNPDDENPAIFNIELPEADRRWNQNHSKVLAWIESLPPQANSSCDTSPSLYNTEQANTRDEEQVWQEGEEIRGEVVRGRARW